jgi:hypothetical protein
VNESNPIVSDPSNAEKKGHFLFVSSKKEKTTGVYFILKRRRRTRKGSLVRIFSLNPEGISLNFPSESTTNIINRRRGWMIDNALTTSSLHPLSRRRGRKIF